MDFVKRLLKSSIKSCISKYIENDLQLNQMEYQEGIFELKGFMLNCNQINKHIHENTDFAVCCKSVNIGSMKIHPSWSNVVQKIEFDDAHVVLSQDNNPDDEHTLGVLDDIKNFGDDCNNSLDSSLFYYLNNEQVLQDSLSDSIAAIEKDIAGYQNVLDYVEKVTKEFVGSFNNLIIEYKDLRLHIGKVIYEQKENTVSVDIKNVNVVVGGVSVVWLEQLVCTVAPKNVKISIPSNVKSKLILRFDVVWLLIKYISELTNKSSDKNAPFSDKNVFSKRQDSSSTNFEVSIPHVDLQLEDQFAKLQDIKIQKKSNNLYIKIQKVSSPFLNSSLLSIGILTNDIASSNNDDPVHMNDPVEESVVLTPFSDKVCYYADGDQKPSELGEQEKQEKFKETQKKNSSKHIVCSAAKTWIEWKTFYAVIQRLFKKKKAVDGASQESNSHPQESDDEVSFTMGPMDNDNTDYGNKAHEENEAHGANEDTEEDIPDIVVDDNESTNDSVNDKKGKKWFEFQLNETTVMYDDVFTFHGSGVNVCIGEHFVNIESKAVVWAPMKRKVCQWSNIHCVTALNLSQVVLNADKCVVTKLSEIKKHITPLITMDGDAPDCQINMKFKHILCENLIELYGLDGMFRASLIGHGLEIFNTTNSFNVTLQKSIVKFHTRDDEIVPEKILGVSMVHVNHFTDGKIRFSIGTLKGNLDAVHIKTITEHIADTVNANEKIIVQKQGYRKKGAVSSFQLVDDYKGVQGRKCDNNTKNDAFLKGDIKTMCIQIKHKNKWDASNYAALKGTGVQIVLHSSNRMSIDLKNIEIIDGVRASLWNKAMYTNDIKIIRVDNYLSVEVPNDVFLNIDQNFLMFVEQLFEWDPPSPDHSIAGLPPPVNRSAKPPFSSMHISETTFRIDYKPKQTADFFEFVNFVPLRNAKVVFREFYMFNIRTFEELAQKITINLISNLRNIQGVVAGMKPIKPVAKILANAQNVVILPLNTKLDANYASKIKKQLGKIAKNTTVEVLELGCGLNVSLKNKTSVYANQPATIGEGITHAKREFKNGMNTVFAFVRNAEDLDVLSLPIAVVKPFTGSFSKLLLGICNQLDPDRKKRADAKYNK